MCANSNSHFHMRAEMADITTTDEASKRRTKKPKKAQQAHLTNESQANSTTKEVPTTVNSHDQSNPSGDESAQLAIDSGDATAGNFSKQSRRKRNSHQRRDLISGSTAATTDAGDSSDDEQFFTVCVFGRVVTGSTDLLASTNFLTHPILFNFATTCCFAF